MTKMRAIDSTLALRACIVRGVGARENVMSCSHVLNIVHRSKPEAAICDGCARLSDTWLQLRMCMECGYIGCCDSSANQHATAHFRATGHPLARSIEPGEEWAWCYVHKLWFESVVPS